MLSPIIVFPIRFSWWANQLVYYHLAAEQGLRGSTYTCPWRYTKLGAAYSQGQFGVNIKKQKKTKAIPLPFNLFYLQCFHKIRTNFKKRDKHCPYYRFRTLAKHWGQRASMLSYISPIPTWMICQRLVVIDCQLISDDNKNMFDTGY